MLRQLLLFQFIGINLNPFLLRSDLNLPTDFTSDPHWLYGIQGGADFPITSHLSALFSARILYQDTPLTEQKDTVIQRYKAGEIFSPGIDTLFSGAITTITGTNFDDDMPLSNAIGDEISTISIQLQFGIKFGIDQNTEA